MCKGRNKSSTPHSDSRRSPSREEKEACPVNTPKSKTRASMNMYLAKTSKEPLLKSNNFKQDHLDFIGSIDGSDKWTDRMAKTEYPFRLGKTEYR